MPFKNGALLEENLIFSRISDTFQKNLLLSRQRPRKKIKLLRVIIYYCNKI